MINLLEILQKTEKEFPFFVEKELVFPFLKKGEWYNIKPFLFFQEANMVYHITISVFLQK